MLLPITQYGSAVLRKPASRVPAVTPELRRLAVDMLETMYAAKGVGLAAQQVGRIESACVIDVPPECDSCGKRTTLQVQKNQDCTYDVVVRTREVVAPVVDEWTQGTSCRPETVTSEASAARGVPS